MKQKYLYSSLFFLLIFFAIIPICSSAQDCPIKEGLVPCSNDPSGECPCDLCMLFLMVWRVIDFLLFRLTPPFAVLMFVIGGALFLTSGGSPTRVTQAKRIIASTIIGLVVLYGSYFFIGVLLRAIGLAQWTTDIYRSWWESGFFEIPC